MSEMNLNIENILNELSKENVSEKNPLAIILNNPKEFPTELIEKLSIETALKYWNGTIDYGVGNRIMNCLYDFWVWNEHYFENYVFSGIAMECYEAFDSGEYYHDGDEQTIDPVEKYTKPKIENLLRRTKLIA